MIDKVQIVNVLLTRKCNLRCSYCKIVRDIPEVPSYPTIDYYNRNELKPEQWIEIIKRIVKNNRNVFFIFYGGEPFLYKGLSDILIYCNDNKVNYTIISNNTDSIQTIIYDTYHKVKKFSGFTSSVDPIIVSDLPEDSDIKKKSKSGFERLSQIKKSGMSDDVVAEITVTRSTILYLYKLVKMLSDNGIYSSITTLDIQKNKYYDFSTVTDSNELVEQCPEIRSEFDKILKDKSLLIHIPEVLDRLYRDLPSNMKCSIFNNVHNMTIDSDGSFRLCLRIRGHLAPNLCLDNVIDSEGVIQKQFKQKLLIDYNNFCEGCNWTCIYFSNYYSDQIINH